jgi:hypothetical protein
MDKHIISKDQVGNPHNRGNTMNHIMCWWFFHFVVTSSSRILEIFRIKKNTWFQPWVLDIRKFSTNLLVLIKNWQRTGDFKVCSEMGSLDL